MSENDGIGFALDREFENLLPIGMTTELETIHLSANSCLIVKRIEYERLAGSRFQKLATWRVGIAITDEANTISSVPQQTRR